MSTKLQTDVAAELIFQTFVRGALTLDNAAYWAHALELDPADGRALLERCVQVLYPENSVESA